MERKPLSQVLRDASIDIRKEYNRLYYLFFEERHFTAINSIMLKDYCEGVFFAMPFCQRCISLNDFNLTYNKRFKKKPEDFDFEGIDCRVLTIDATGLALEILGRDITNVPMLGALCRVLGLSKEKMTAEIENQWPGAKAKPNTEAALEAYDAVSFKGGAE